MSKINILIVEDTPDLLPRLHDDLLKHAVRVDAARDGFAALCAVQQRHYYLALVKSQVAGLSGVFVAKQLRKHNPELQVILVCPTPLSLLNTHRCREHGFWICNTPHNPHILLHTVRRIYEQTFLNQTDDHQT